MIKSLNHCFFKVSAAWGTNNNGLLDIKKEKDIPEHELHPVK